jgi:hypothetical protein
MTRRKFIKPAAAVAAFAAIVLAGMLSSSPRVKATDDDDEDRNESKIRRGFEIAPVPLNLEGKSRALVGLGSYIVNAQGDCNGATAPVPLPNSFRVETPTLASPRSSTRQPTWLAAEILVRTQHQILPYILFPAT